MRFPDGTVVRASGLPSREENATWREYGLYLDPEWQPTWPATLIEWPDYGIPTNPSSAVRQIQSVFLKARSGTHVEIGCLGGTGRTGTVVACMAILAGVPPETAVDWARSVLSPYAIETEEQEQWVRWFGRNAVGVPRPNPESQSAD